MNTNPTNNNNNSLHRIHLPQQPSYEDHELPLIRRLFDPSQQGKLHSLLVNTEHKSSLLIDLDLLMAMDEDEEYAQLAHRIQMNTKRYEELFHQAIQSIDHNTAVLDEDSPVDVLIQQRLQLQQQQLSQQEEQDTTPSQSMLPDRLMRRFQVRFKCPMNNQKSKSLAVREARGHLVGQLIAVRGMVTRVSDVKPFMTVCTYTCSSCHSEVFQEVMSEQFTPLSECPSRQCTDNKVKGELVLQTRGSRFMRFQEAKIQELTDQVPMGHIPRSMTVYLFDDVTRQMTAGDVVTLSGVLLPKVYRGFRAMRVGLLTETYLEVMHVEQMKKQYAATADVSDTELQEQVQAIRETGQAYQVLSQSIAPEIYGHDDVKKALLLLMVGGVTHHGGDGMRIRGQINVCLMGDPGVAKSQMLKWVARAVPRGVYTTGKGSSGVGLTAVVIKDPVTGEMVLEGGSLVLADNGICCIDEFDKMEESDRTAIHEVMEQQTVSISKAGINTTLNARASILAAANPAYSRYNSAKSVSENINLPHALLSRFDLLFLMRDVSDRDYDVRMAEHILFVHRNGRQPDLAVQPYSAAVIRAFIAEARRHDPVLPVHLEDFIVGAYVQKRSEALDAQKRKNGDFIYTQPRTLLAILRMSQALARLRLADVIEEGDIREALRLMDSSKKTMEGGDAGETGGRRRDPVLVYYNEIKKLALERGVTQLGMDEIRDRLRVLGGFDEGLLGRAIESYENANVWARVGNTLVMIA